MSLLAGGSRAMTEWKSSSRSDTGCVCVWSEEFYIGMLKCEIRLCLWSCIFYSKTRSVSVTDQ